MLRLAVPRCGVGYGRSYTCPRPGSDEDRHRSRIAHSSWKTIGGFCGIGDWHPVIEKCVLSKKGGKEERTLSLKGGGTIVEQEQAANDKKMGYTYTILSGRSRLRTTNPRLWCSRKVADLRSPGPATSKPKARRMIRQKKPLLVSTTPA